MKIEFANPDLDKLAFDPLFVGEWSWNIKRYQKVIVTFQAIKRRESLLPLAGKNFEGLTGKRKRHRKKEWEKEYSVRLDDRWRVVLTFTGHSKDETILILDVEDYH